MAKKRTSSKKGSLLKMTKTSPLLRNKNMLMFVFSCYMLAILGYILTFDYQSLTLLLLLTIISSGFSRNMIINLGLPFLFVGLMVFMRYIFKGGMREGMESNSDEEEEENSQENYENNEQENYENNEQENYENNEQENYTGSHKRPPPKKGHRPPPKKGHRPPPKKGHRPPPKKSKQGFSNINNNKTSTELSKVINHYENAQKGFQSAIDKSKMNPQDLEAQQELVRQMGDMTPVLKESAKLLERVDMDNLNKLIGGLGKVMENNPLGVLNQKS